MLKGLLMEKYQPIACQFYDVLELLASRREQCTIAYFKDGKTVETVESRIKDIFTREKEEFLKLSDETEIRLDQIISVNNTQFYGSCAF